MEVKIKVCDIRDVTTARFCVENGVDFIGLHQIYGPIRDEKVSLFTEIKSVVGHSKLVLVTRETNIENLMQICSAFEFDYIQMHFSITVPEIIDFKTLLKIQDSKIGLIAVVSTDDIDNVDIYGLYEQVDFLLFDTSYHGGTGVCSSDENINKIIRKASGTNFFFAGGLNPENVAEKIKRLNPFGVDVQSGVEVTGQKHVKDFSKILRFVQETQKSV